MTLRLLIKEIVDENPIAEGEVRYRLLFRQLQQAILQGRLPAGAKLPATRELADLLGIARNTVKSSYEMLAAEGYIDSKTGAGSFVAELPEAWLKPKAIVEEVFEPLVISDYANKLLDLRPLNSDVKRLLQPAIPSLDHFPIAQWKRCLGSAAGRIGLLSSPPEGVLMLREQIADYLLKNRGIEVPAKQIIVTSGSQQAAYMVAHLLTNSGDQVLVETPGFQGTAGAFSAAGCQVSTISLDHFCQTDLHSGISLISVTPSRNFPLGHTLPLETRLSLIHWAEESGGWILEDDYDSEYAVGRPVSAIYSISERQRVIYTGTFSRSMFPSLRLGYLVLPKALVSVFAQARRYMDGGLSQVPQVAMAEFMQQGFFARHLKKMKQLYMEKSTYCLDAITSNRWLGSLPILDAEGGMHIVLGLPDGMDDAKLVSELNQSGLGVRALSGYCQGGEKIKGLVIGFCFENYREIDQGVDLIASHFKHCLDQLDQVK